MNKFDLGGKIETIRLELGESKTDFGKRFKATGSLVNKWENNSVTPNNERLKAIADLAGITVNELLGVERYDKQEIIDAIHDDDTMELIIKAKTIGEDEPEYIKKINEQALDNIINAIESSRIHFQNYEIISMYIDVCKGAKVYDLVTLCNYLIDLRDKRIRYMEMFKDTDFIAPMYANEISRLNGYIDSIKRQLESEK